MKFFCIILALGSVSALGSGPYLPSGWRPDGPAFYLPSEIKQKPAENPLKDTILQETEASGSDFLREYGPPKDVSQDITKQDLPEAVTEIAFFNVEAKLNQGEGESAVKDTSEMIQEAISIKSSADISESNVAVTEIEQVIVTEANVEQSTAAEEEVTTTEAQILEELTTVKVEDEPIIRGKSISLLVEASVAETEDFNEATIVTEQNVILANEITAAAEKEIQKEADVKTLEEGVQNIAEGVVNLENRADVQKEQVVGITELKTQISGSLEQAPEGFLEYGPPGFREYGPPKQDEVLGITDQDKPSGILLIENNEARRRRFSPKFRSTKHH